MKDISIDKKIEDVLLKEKMTREDLRKKFNLTSTKLETILTRMTYKTFLVEADYYNKTFFWIVK